MVPGVQSPSHAGQPGGRAHASDVMAESYLGEKLLFESAWKKEKDIVCKEIEKLRGSIQTLCKSALPLGKMMDYLQEDVDAMQHELQLWHGENRQHAEALQKEQSITDCAVEPLKAELAELELAVHGVSVKKCITDCAVEPLKAELAELEQQVKDQQEKICAVKANILRNEEKIQKMVYSINLTSRSQCVLAGVPSLDWVITMETALLYFIFCPLQSPLPTEMEYQGTRVTSATWDVPLARQRGPGDWTSVSSEEAERRADGAKGHIAGRTRSTGEGTVQLVACTQWAAGPSTDG
ncbi:TRAF3-interacting protein 1 [Fukomys damarensis]|uniref:TRAF3-interacting protein 1 n=1 Tax=Fukomys damarensis TaxID=885580 RepID=A0A091DTY6_FUKDA|nr:TRAF3-interacting protein 1 [Fukomys damarensis]